MSSYLSQVPATSLRQRMIDDMNMRRYARETQRNYVRDVARFATYLGRPPDTATAEDLRQFQIDQRASGIGVPTMNSIVAALRFFFTHTLDRPDLSRKLFTVKRHGDIRDAQLRTAATVMPTYVPDRRHVSDGQA